MRRARTRRGAVAVVTAVLPLGGCGIQGTDVIEAGAPASVQAFVDRDSDMLLFFRAPDGGLNPVIRTTGSTVAFGPEGGLQSGAGSQDSDGTADGPVPTEKVIFALLRGPGEEDRAAGLGTSLPASAPEGTIRIGVSHDGTVTVGLPIAVRGLDGTALRQLICTIAYSEDVGSRGTVRLDGLDGVSRSGTCGLDPTERRRP
ncbi:hypothetical protein ABZZ79_08095 [Streptomyces sp. NPDC006458]|uniref:hypothetical protein n=1 Tax=Streptomyces sp. NPDC006458 TaxID=3154302 RepID=UPI0033BF42E9